jgi:NADPH:quinone reductase-like Zn-dependent oxidoreductase
MRAVRLHDYGDVDQLRIEDVPRPEPKAGEVLIRVEATSVNPVDCKQRSGALKSFMPLSLPAILGSDVAGEVVALGQGVAGYNLGDKVYGMPGPGGGTYAEYVAVHSNGIGRVPRNISMLEAASLPAVTATAFAALFHYAPLTKGQTVLIHGAAGGVGTIAVQLAKWAGTKVFATGSTGSADLIKSLGADVFIDYRSQQFEDIAKNLDLVFDAVGGEMQERSWACLKPGGMLVSLVQPPRPEAMEHAKARGVLVYGRIDSNERAKVTELIEAGKIRPVIDRILPLESISDAHRYVEAGHAHGKVVLRVR